MSRPGYGGGTGGRVLRELDAETARARDEASAADWDPGLSPAAFVARERLLQRLPFARGRIAWGWWEGDRPCASCETFVRDWPLGRVWLVASVWTEPALRGRGCASALLRALAEALRPAPGAAGMVLFSDVDPAMYARLGFLAWPARDLRWAAEAADPDDGPWTRFPESELPTVPARDPEQLAWQVDRARTRAERLPTRRPARVGARLPGGAWMVWSEGEAGALEVLAHDAPTPGAWRCLAAAAARTAAAAGLAEVVAWDPGPVADGPRAPRRGKLPMVLPFRDGWDLSAPPGRDAWV